MSDPTNPIVKYLATNPEVKVKALKQLPLWLAGGGAAGLLAAAAAASRPASPGKQVEENDRRYLSDAIKLQKYSADSTLAGDLMTVLGRGAETAGDMIGSAANKTMEAVIKPTLEGVSGMHATHPVQLPFFIPAAAGLTAAGLYGGNVLGRKLFSGVRKDRRQEEKERARREYEEALAAFSKSSKEASENEMANNLERLYQHFGAEKTANEPLARRHLGTLAGLYLAALGGLGVTGAMKGYKNQRKYDDMRKIEQAAKLEQLENQDQLNPTRIEYVQ